MNELNELLRQRQSALKKIIAKCRRSLANMPKGSLRAVSDDGTPRYYFRTSPSDRYGKYLNAKSLNTAVRLAQRDYNQTVLKAALEELSAIDTLIKLRTACLVEDCYDKLKDARRLLVSPVTESDQEYAREWQNKPYTPKEFSPFDYSNYYSMKGERMRSKSEVIIANLLNSLEIPYKYECPVILENGATIHPDFTILNKRTRKIYYLEHLGRMGENTYADENVVRLNELILSGFILGLDLIVSIETYNEPLNTKALEAQLRAIAL